MLNRCLFLYRERGKPIEIKVNDVFEQMDMIIIIIPIVVVVSKAICKKTMRQMIELQKNMFRMW
jgi:hypothetical protein